MYDQQKVKDHLITCLEHKEVSQFPVATKDKEEKFKTHKN